MCPLSLFLCVCVCVCSCCSNTINLCMKKAEEEDDSLEEEWNLMQDSIMNNMVQTHNQLFGSMDLVKTVCSL